MNSRLLPALLAVLAAAFLAGCNTTAKTATQAEKPKAAQAEEETVEVSSTGSWLPRKVKKKRDLVGDATQQTSAEALQKVQDLGKANVAREGR